MMWNVSKLSSPFRRTTTTKVSLVFIYVSLYVVFNHAIPCYALSSANIPLDSPIYDYIEKLSGIELIDSDIRGLRPYSGC